MKTRKQFILSELIVPFCYTSVCIVMAIICYTLPEKENGDLGVAIFSMFAVFSIFIWAAHIKYAKDLGNYYDYIRDYKAKKQIEKQYADKINKELEEQKP